MNIIYPTDYLPTPNKEQMRLIESFVRDMENFLGVKRTEISLSQMWEETRPDLAEGIDLPEYLKTVRQELMSLVQSRMLTLDRLQHYPTTRMLVNFWTTSYKAIGDVLARHPSFIGHSAGDGGAPTYPHADVPSTDGPQGPSGFGKTRGA